jgi:hypothetical protein
MMANYIRKRHMMLNEDGSIYQECASISKAKKLSRELQKQGHKMKVDHSDDPKPKPVTIPRYGKRSDSANRFILRKEREERELALARKKRDRGVELTPMELRRLGAMS